jgi:hypothetical protein
MKSNPQTSVAAHAVVQTTGFRRKMAFPSLLTKVKGDKTGSRRLLPFSKRRAQRAPPPPIPPPVEKITVNTGDSSKISDLTDREDQYHRVDVATAASKKVSPTHVTLQHMTSATTGGTVVNSDMSFQNQSSHFSYSRVAAVGEKKMPRRANSKSKTTEHEIFEKRALLLQPPAIFQPSKKMEHMPLAPIGKQTLELDSGLRLSAPSPIALDRVIVQQPASVKYSETYGKTRDQSKEMQLVEEVDDEAKRLNHSRESPTSTISSRPTTNATSQPAETVNVVVSDHVNGALLASHNKTTIESAKSSALDEKKPSSSCTEKSLSSTTATTDTSRRIAFEKVRALLNRVKPKSIEHKQLEQKLSPTTTKPSGREDHPLLDIVTPRIKNTSSPFFSGHRATSQNDEIVDSLAMSLSPVDMHLKDGSVNSISFRQQGQSPNGTDSPPVSSRLSKPKEPPTSPIVERVPVDAPEYSCLPELQVAPLHFLDKDDNQSVFPFVPAEPEASLRAKSPIERSGITLYSTDSDAIDPPKDFHFKISESCQTSPLNEDPLKVELIEATCPDPPDASDRQLTAENDQDTKSHYQQKERGEEESEPCNIQPALSSESHKENSTRTIGSGSIDQTFIAGTPRTEHMYGSGQKSAGFQQFPRKQKLGTTRTIDPLQQRMSDGGCKGKEDRMVELRPGVIQGFGNKLTESKSTVKSMPPEFHSSGPNRKLDNCQRTLRTNPFDETSDDEIPTPLLSPHQMISIQPQDFHRKSMRRGRRNELLRNNPRNRAKAKQSRQDENSAEKTAPSRVRKKAVSKAENHRRNQTIKSIEAREAQNVAQAPIIVSANIKDDTKDQQVTAARDLPLHSLRSKTFEVLPQEISLSPNDPVSDLDHSLRHFPVRNVVNNGSVDVSWLDPTQTETMSSHESGGMNDADRYATFPSASNKSRLEFDDMDHAALADSITDWTIEQGDTADTGEAAIELMINTCNQTPLGKMLVQSVFSQNKTANVLAKETKSVCLGSGATRESLSGPPRSSLVPGESFKKHSMRAAEHKLEPLGFDPVPSISLCESERQQKEPDGIQPVPSLRRNTKDRYAVEGVAHSKDTSLSAFSPIKVAQEVPCLRQIAKQRSVSDKLVQFGENILCLSPQSRHIVEDKMQRLSPSSRSLLQCSVAKAKGASFAEVIDLSGAESLDDLDDDGVWLFDLSPRNEAEKNTEEVLSNVEGKAISLSSMKDASDISKDKFIEHDSNGKSSKNLEDVMDFAASFLKSFHQKAATDKKSLISSASGVIDLTNVDEVDPIVIVQGVDIQSAIIEVAESKDLVVEEEEGRKILSATLFTTEKLERTIPGEFESTTSSSVKESPSEKLGKQTSSFSKENQSSVLSMKSLEKDLLGEVEDSECESNRSSNGIFELSKSIKVEVQEPLQPYFYGTGFEGTEVLLCMEQEKNNKKKGTEAYKPPDELIFRTDDAGPATWNKLEFAEPDVNKTHLSLPSKGCCGGSDFQRASESDEEEMLGKDSGRRQSVVPETMIGRANLSKGSSKHIVNDCSEVKEYAYFSEGVTGYSFLDGAVETAYRNEKIERRPWIKPEVSFSPKVKGILEKENLKKQEDFLFDSNEAQPLEVFTQIKPPVPEDLPRRMSNCRQQNIDDNIPLFDETDDNRVALADETIGDGHDSLYETTNAVVCDARNKNCKDSQPYGPCPENTPGDLAHRNHHRRKNEGCRFENASFPSEEENADHRDIPPQLAPTPEKIFLRVSHRSVISSDDHRPATGITGVFNASAALTQANKTGSLSTNNHQVGATAPSNGAKDHASESIQTTASPLEIVGKLDSRISVKKRDSLFAVAHADECSTMNSAISYGEKTEGGWRKKSFTGDSKTFSIENDFTITEVNIYRSKPSHESRVPWAFFLCGSHADEGTVSEPIQAAQKDISASQFRREDPLDAGRALATQANLIHGLEEDGGRMDVDAGIAEGFCWTPWDGTFNGGDGKSSQENSSMEQDTVVYKKTAEGRTEIFEKQENLIFQEPDQIESAQYDQIRPGISNITSRRSCVGLVDETESQSEPALSNRPTDWLAARSHKSDELSQAKCSRKAGSFQNSSTAKNQESPDSCTRRNAGKANQTRCRPTFTAGYVRELASIELGEDRRTINAVPHRIPNEISITNTRSARIVSKASENLKSDTAHTTPFEPGGDEINATDPESNTYDATVDQPGSSNVSLSSKRHTARDCAGHQGTWQGKHPLSSTDGAPTKEVQLPVFEYRVDEVFEAETHSGKKLTAETSKVPYDEENLPDASSIQIPSEVDETDELLLALTRSEAEAAIAIDSNSDSSASAKATIEPSTWIELVSTEESSSPSHENHADSQHSTDTAPADKRCEARGDAFDTLSRVEQMRALVENLPCSQIDAGFPVASSKTPSLSQNATQENSSVSEDEPESAKCNNRGAKQKEFTRSPRLQHVLERLRGRNERRKDDISLSSSSVEAVDPDDLFNRYDNIVKHMIVADDERLERAQQKREKVSDSIIDVTDFVFQASVPGPSHSTIQKATMDIRSQLPPLSRARPSVCIFKANSFGSEVSSTPSQKARNLRSQLNAALQTSAAIRTSQELLGVELNSFKSRLHVQRCGPSPRGTGSPRLPAQPNYAQNAESVDCLQQTRASEALPTPFGKETLTDTPVAVLSKGAGIGSVMSTSTPKNASDSSLQVPIRSLHHLDSSETRDEVIHIEDFESRSDEDLFIESDLAANTEAIGNLFDDSEDDDDDEVRLKQLDSIIHGLRSADERKRAAEASAMRNEYILQGQGSESTT